MKSDLKHKKLLYRTLKIAVGSSLAIYIATVMNLQYAASAGIITLLTIVTTKWETFRLSAFRFLSSGISIAAAEIIFQIVKTKWISFGIYMLLIVLISSIMEWQATISVNAVIGTHFLSEKNFSYEFIENEFWLVVIGTAIAVAFNLFHNNKSQKKQIILNMRQTEKKLQIILGELAAYLDNRQMQRDVWQDICSLETELQQYMDTAYEYQQNTFHSHPQYYINYFEMRMKQCGILHNLHYEINKLRNIPEQAQLVSGYILYMAGFVAEYNEPAVQIDKLEVIVQEMRQQSLPASTEEFEGRAVLYHILMDLEEFLVYKRRFVQELTEKEKGLYWSAELPGQYINE